MPLSEKQSMYLAIAWRCFDAEPKIDYERFATEAGLASAASARELMRVTKNKLKSEYGSLGAGLKEKNGTPKKKATPRKRKNQAEEAIDAGDGEGGENVAEAPKSVKKAKKGKKAGEEATQDAEGEVGEEGEVAVKPEVTEDDEFSS